MVENYKLGLIGYPIKHSYSPLLYNTAFRELNIQGSYEILETKPEDLVPRIKYLRANKYYGFNVTIPHKVPVGLFLTRYDDNVNLTGSVNTVKIEDDSTLTGYNTDVFGFMKAIPDDVDLNGKKAVIIGTGGAARAVCTGLYKKGIKNMDIYTRNVINSSDVINGLRNKFPSVSIRGIQNSLMNGLEDVDILVNTTPVGMKNFDEDNSPVDDKNIESLPAHAIVYDIVYNPLETALISKAVKCNKRYILGIDMLIWQAVKAFEIWTGKTPDFNLLKSKVFEQMLINKT